MRTPIQPYTEKKCFEIKFVERASMNGSISVLVAFRFEFYEYIKFNNLNKNMYGDERRKSEQKIEKKLM